MAVLPTYKVWDGKLLHNVSELAWVAGGIKWYGPGVGKGWAYINPDFNWKLAEKPILDLLLEVVEHIE